MKLALVLISFLSQSAFAQTPAPSAAEGKVLGWKNSANLGANLSFTSSQDVVGQTDGNSETYGLNLKGSAIQTKEFSEWRNEGSLVGTTTRTPNVPRFVKSSDELKIGTAYLHFWNGNPNFGPYARAEAAAPMFKGENVQSENKTFRVHHNNAPDDVFTASSVRLTDGFRPLTTKEAVGVFWRPKNEDRIKIETRLGIAALQIAASGQFATKGTNTAGEIEVNELSDVSQAGVEAAVNVKGKINDNSAYEAGVETMTPFVNNQASNDDRDALRLTNIDGFAKLTSKINSWASFGYDYKVKIQPQLVDKTQQIHMLVLNVNYNLL
jgi:hypothetical protein